MKNVAIKNFKIGKNQPLTIVAGPCVIEGESSLMEAADYLTKKMSQYPVNFIFKASFDKANRSSFNSFRGPGVDQGLYLLEKVQKTFGVPVVSDVHTVEQAKMAGQVLDVIQIPAFLCRQTDLVVACAETGKVVQVKKGQFMSPWDMGNVVDKIKAAGNDQIILVDRGVSFGYNNLVSDMRAIPVMQNFGYPVCFDATHSVQLPGGLGHLSGGQKEFIAPLAKAAIAAGADALFIETHPNPSQAKSDAASMLSYDELDALLRKVVAIYEVVNR